MEIADEILFALRLEDKSLEPELVPELLGALEMDFSSYESREDGSVYHQLYFPDPESREAGKAVLSGCLADWAELGAELSFAGECEVHKKDWAESWKKYFQPIEISSRLLVRPSWIDTPPSPGQKVLTIDPGMSFGTGQHATTLFCMQMIDKLSVDPEVKTMLDAGCGSGILSIAAGLLGYEKVDLFDFDPDAVMVARENLELNGLTHIHPEVGNAADYPGAPEKYDLVCANILGHLLAAFSGNIIQWVKPGKYLALAGILEEEFDTISAHYTALGFKELERCTLREWTSGLFQKL